MAFDVAADAYGRFMGRYAEPLAELFLDVAGVRRGQRALDVGCGPGAVTTRLAERLGAAAVSAVEPSEPFLAAVRERCPAVDVRRGVAEDLPFADGTFDVALAQLVVHFMSDPVSGLAEMTRVVSAGGIVAASVWDYGGDRAPLSTFWRAVRALDPAATDESGLPGARRGQLGDLARAAGLEVVLDDELTVTVPYDSFDDWWEPYTLGVGPAGDHVAGLAPDARAELRARCAELLPAGGFEVAATAWVVVGRH